MELPEELRRFRSPESSGLVGRCFGGRRRRSFSWELGPSSRASFAYGLVLGPLVVSGDSRASGRGGGVPCCGAARR
eukprot:8586538-Pyramimonas_sp.AAC.1